MKDFLQGKKTYITIALGLISIAFSYFAGFDLEGQTVQLTLGEALTAASILLTQLFTKVGLNRTEAKIS